MTTNRMGLEQEDDHGLSAQLEVLEAMTAPGDAENQQLICLLLELKRRRVNQQAIEAELQEYRKASKDPVAWQFYDDGGWHNGSNHNNHRENTERAGYRVRELYARAAPPLQAVPDGWQLVPIEPTYQMSEAIGLPWEQPPFPIRWKRMLAAAPQQ